MTTVGLLYPGHSAAEDDYPRMETLLNGVNVPIVHTRPGQDVLAAEGGLAAGTEELRLSGAEAVVWADTDGSATHGWEGGQERIRALALAAGLPASSTAFGFVHAVRELGAGRVAVASGQSPEELVRFTRFLAEAGVRVLEPAGTTGTVGAVVPPPEAEEPRDVVELVRASDHPEAEVVLVPDTALSTVALLPELEAAIGKPVLTANQVTLWEGLRLAERRGAWSTELGALFARKE
ncbi:decarboxylase [Streptomyces sp. LP05-1]|uniref:Decarboxylase n=1 Tax=Streptomyces pyxinae TaxID=2970734 RepID=A0ABT2CCZ3_9ACTN|nr:decarboxylase [Streptomyces sp. LP05-1]MCS0634621.1 decarboxylase [Streptomyces sp. LP05-1]